MANVASPYGLRPINLIGGQAFNGGVIREIRMTANTATGIFNGDLVKIASGQPTAVVTGDSPVAMNLGTTAGNATAGAPRGVVGVCVGVSYVDPILKYQVFCMALKVSICCWIRELLTSVSSRDTWLSFRCRVYVI